MELHLLDYLEARRALVEKALEARLPAADAQPVQVHQAMRYALLGAGKRLCPILTLAVSDMAGWRPDQMMNAACAIEFVHAASLILDDLPSMDNALFRRDKLCTHIAFGEATALLAAIGLIAIAFDLVAANAETYAPNFSSVEAVRELALAIGTSGLILGQHHDPCHCGQQTTLEEVELAECSKAGALFIAAVQIPAFFVGFDRLQVESLDTYARNMGLAFQIRDDLIDAASESEDAGKNTFITHLGIAGAGERVNALLDEALTALAVFDDEAEPLRKLADYVRTRSF